MSTSIKGGTIGTLWLGKILTLRTLPPSKKKKRNWPKKEGKYASFSKKPEEKYARSTWLYGRMTQGQNLCFFPTNVCNDEANMPEKGPIATSRMGFTHSLLALL